MQHLLDKTKRQNQSYQDEKNARKGSGELKKQTKSGTLEEYKSPVMFDEDKKKYSTQSVTTSDGKPYTGKLYKKSTLPKPKFQGSK